MSIKKIKEIKSFIVESDLRKRFGGTQLSSAHIDIGWGNGYVIIPKGLPGFGMSYDEVREKYNISAPGGLTFDGSGNEIKHWKELEKKYRTKNYWIVGFDTAHYGDSLAKWPKERVQEEADKLAFQFYELAVKQERSKTKRNKRKIKTMTKYHPIDVAKEIVESVEEAAKHTSIKVSAKKEKWNEAGDEKAVHGFITLNDYFKVEVGVYNIMRRNIKKTVNTLLLGPTGVGKTELVSNLAQELKLPLTIFDMGTMSDPIMSLVGTHAIKVIDGHTTSEFVKSRFSDMIQNPGIVLLDELSRASATANNLLFPCLDFRRELSMEYCFDDCAPIKVHPKCVFVATANLGSQYTGTHKLDRALIDRFMLIEIDPLDTVRVKEAIKKHTPAVSDAEVNKLVKCYDEINTAHDTFAISFNLSIRHLKLIAELVQDGFTIYDSFYTICKGIGGKEGLKSLETILSVTKTK